MNGKPTHAVRSQPVRPVQDEWGVFDPEQAGMAATLRTLREDVKDEPRAPAPKAREAAVRPAPPVETVTRAETNARADLAGRAEMIATAHCKFCAEALAPGVRKCPACAREIAAAGNRAAAPLASVAPVDPVGDEGSEGSEGTDASGSSQAGAVYTLEHPTRCPHCENQIRTFRVLRLLRTQVSFTSTLPRKGYAIVCPDCERLISAELSGMI